MLTFSMIVSCRAFYPTLRSGGSLIRQQLACFVIRRVSRWRRRHLPVRNLFLRMGLGEESEGPLTPLANALAGRTIWLQSQISIQIPHLCAIVAFARVDIRQPKIGIRQVRVTENRLLRAFFRFVPPVELQEGVT